MKVDRHILSKYFVKIGFKKDNSKQILETPETKEIKNLYTLGYSIGYISKIIGRSTNFITKIIQYYNIENKQNVYRKYNIEDESIFEIINTEEKAYWLGFLYADGCIGNSTNIFRNSIEIGLKAVDRNHIVKFLDFIMPKEYENYPISFKVIKSLYPNSKKVFHYSWRAIVFSKKMVEDLRNKGCVSAKSLILKFPTLDQVDPSLIRHFIRGYFDGDGSISIRDNTKLTFSFTGAKEFCSEIETILLNNGIIDSKHLYFKNNICQISHSNMFQVKKIFDYIYKDATIFLDRKYYVFHYILHNNMPS